MGELVRLIIDCIAYVWPLRIVKYTERGIYMVCGRWIWDVGPGVYPIMPWFIEVETAHIPGSRIGTGRQDLSLFDGSTLSFSASVWSEVVDARKALTCVDGYRSTALEDLASILADELAELDPDRLRPRRRGALFRELEAKVAAKHAVYGVKSSDLTFNSFVLGVKMHRHLIDQIAVQQW